MMLHLLACLFVDELYECFFVGGEDLGLLCCAICLLTLKCAFLMKEMHTNPSVVRMVDLCPGVCSI